MPYIALLCPAAISLAIFRKRRGSNLKTIDNVLAYLGFALMINWFTMIVSVHFLKVYGAILDSLKGFEFFIKYVALAMVFALVLPAIFDMFYKLFIIKFDDKSAPSKKDKDGK